MEMTQEREQYIERKLMETLNSFKESMKKVAEDAVSEVYGDVLPYVVSDAEFNIANRVEGCVKNLIAGDFQDVSTDELSIILKVSDSYGMKHRIHISNYTKMFDKIYEMYKYELQNEKIKALESEVNILRDAVSSRNGYY